MNKIVPVERRGINSMADIFENRMHVFFLLKLEKIVTC